MTERKGKPTGQGYHFGGAKARELKARLKALKELNRRRELAAEKKAR